MTKNLDLRRVLIFLGFAFGLAWLVSLVIYLTGGLTNSLVLAELAPGVPLTLAAVLMATALMWSPAIANLLTRLVTREKWVGHMLGLNFRRSWQPLLGAWFLPLILTGVGVAIYYALFPQYFDPTMSAIQAQTEAATAQAGQPMTISPGLLVAIQIASAVTIAPLINSIATFGEEFGWRGYLLPKLMPLGWRAAVLISGFVWGMWHWPINWMGYNYALPYPGAPWTGMIMFPLFTISTGILLSWLTLKAGNVWPAVIGHGALNAVASVGILFVHGNPNPLLGPIANGLVAMVAFLAVAVILFVSPGDLTIVEDAPNSMPGETVAAQGAT